MSTPEPFTYTDPSGDTLRIRRHNNVVRFDSRQGSDRSLIDVLVEDSEKVIAAIREAASLPDPVSASPGQAVRLAAQYADRAIENGERADKAEADADAHRLALSLSLGLDAGASWNAIRERASGVAVNRQVLAEALMGLHTLIATSSRDWGTYRVDAWIWAVLCGWDCEQAEHDDTCTHGALEEIAATHGWDTDTVVRARRHRAAVRRLIDQTRGSEAS